MWHLLVLVLLHFILIPTSKSEEESGAEYLKTVMNTLQSEREESFLWHDINQVDTAIGTLHYRTKAGEITGPTPLPDAETELQPSPAEHPKQNLPPPQPLSKEELAALYQAAANKGAILDLASMTSGSVNGIQALQNLFGGLNMNKDHAQEEQGYYYYFYPIKNFDIEPAKTNQVKHKITASQAHKPASQMAAIPTTMMVINSGSNKSVEPLFMAIAGFVGMALMFAFSVLFLPKFGSIRSRGISVLKHVPDELAALTKLVLEGIDGKDCTERIACEVGRALRKMQLDQKPIRVLEILLPPSLGKQLQLIRRAAGKREKCNFIPCKRKRSREL